jgi:hypothetical protein
MAALWEREKPESTLLSERVNSEQVKMDSGFCRDEAAAAPE